MGLQEVEHKSSPPGLRSTIRGTHQQVTSQVLFVCLFQGNNMDGHIMTKVYYHTRLDRAVTP